MPITLTLKRAAEESGLSVRTLYNIMGTGELPSVRVGGRRLIPARALEKFLLRGEGSPAQAEGPRREGSVDEKREGKAVRKRRKL
jgi:excisionase family DNA binding protein